jgi:O-glycosyl hydrolase
MRIAPLERSRCPGGTKPRRVSCVVAAVILSAGGLTGAAGAGSLARAAAATTVRVDPQLQYQTIQGWGTSLAWWAEVAGNWSLASRQALATMLFSPASGIGLNVVRYNIGGVTPGDTCSGAFRPGAAVPSFEPSAGSYDWSADPAQLWWLQQAQDLGASELAGVVYSPPAWMTVSGCSAGADTADTDNLAPSQYQAYASYLTAVAEHFHNTLGLTLQTIAPFNEPDGNWTSSGNQEGMSLQPSSQNALITTIHATMAAAGAAGYSQLSAPESHDSDNVPAWLRGPGAAYGPAAVADIAQINTHDYADQQGGSVYGTAQALGKPVMMSEWGANAASSDPTDISAGLTLSERILKNEQQMHPVSWVIWQALDGGPSGSGLGGCADLWGLACGDLSASSSQQVTYPARFWVMGNYSKYVRPGATVIGSSDTNTLAAYNPGDSTLTLVTTNPSGSAQSYSYNLSGFSAVGAAATPYQTTATEDLAALSPVTVSGKAFSTTLPAQSVTTFVIPGVSYSGAGAAAQVDDAVAGSGLGEFDYSGSGWQHCSGSACGDPQDLYHGTTSWDGQAGDSVTFRFSGVQARLYGVLDTNEGIGDVSVDGGTPTEIDFYAHGRVGDSLVWQTPLLAPGSHTLRLTVSGSKNPQSTGNLIALDRAEVRAQPAPAAGGLVTSDITGSIRNNLTGQAGLELRTGSAPVTVNALGRADLPGDTGPHTVSLYQASDGALVASATVQTGATADPDSLGLSYQALSSAVTLAPDTSYVLVSDETSGGDPFFDADTTVGLAAGFSDLGPAWRSATSGAFTVYTSDPGQAYGPVSLLTSG